MNHLLSLLLFLLVLSVLIRFAPMEHPKLEKIDFGATIHASFHEFEPIHIPLSRTIAPRERESCKNRIFILVHARHKGLKGFEMTGLPQLSQSLLLFGFQIVLLAEKEPGGLLRGEGQERIR